MSRRRIITMTLPPDRWRERTLVLPVMMTRAQQRVPLRPCPGCTRPTRLALCRGCAVNRPTQEEN